MVRMVAAEMKIYRILHEQIFFHEEVGIERKI